MKNIEQTLDSREVAKMVEKEHKFLMRDIRRYIKQIIEGNEKYFTECKIAPSDFFKESDYKDSTGRTLPCYRITKKGCEFIAHKLTGTKGTIFTARYINRFHEMEDILKGQQGPQMPWFIRDFGKQGKIMLFRDFKAITGIELCGTYTAWERPDKLVGGRHWNAWAWREDKEKFKEKFKKEYGFDYGDDDLMNYLYFRGIRKAVRTVENDLKDGKKLTLEAKKLILDGVRSVEGEERKSPVIIPKQEESAKQNPIQICININGNEVCCK